MRIYAQEESEWEITQFFILLDEDEDYFAYVTRDPADSNRWEWDVSVGGWSKTGWASTAEEAKEASINYWNEILKRWETEEE